MRIEDAPLHTLYSRLSTRSRCAGEGAKTRRILPISGSADKHFLAECYEAGVWNRTNRTGTPFHWILPRFGNSRNVKMNPLTASISFFARFRRIQDGYAYQFLSTITEKNTLVGKELCIGGLLGPLETNIKHVRFLIIINPRPALRQPDQMRQRP